MTNPVAPQIQERDERDVPTMGQLVDRLSVALDNLGQVLSDLCNHFDFEFDTVADVLDIEQMLPRGFVWTMERALYDRALRSSGQHPIYWDWYESDPVRLEILPRED